MLPVAAAGCSPGLARVSALRSEPDDHDRPLFRDGGAVRRGMRSHYGIAARDHDSRGTRGRHAGIPGTAASLRDRHRCRAGGDPHAPGCGLHAVDAHSAAVAL